MLLLFLKAYPVFVVTKVLLDARGSHGPYSAKQLGWLIYRVFVKWLFWAIVL